MTAGRSASVFGRTSTVIRLRPLCPLRGIGSPTIACHHRPRPPLCRAVTGYGRIGTFAGFSDLARSALLRARGRQLPGVLDGHKAEWEAEVRDPMRALLAGLEDEFGPAKLFRPNRDIRFSKDKTPYKTHQGAFVAHGTVGVGCYVQVDAEGLLAGGGWRAHEPSTSSATGRRWSATRPGRELAAADGGARGRRLLPRGRPDEDPAARRAADHPRLELLRCRSLMVFRRFGAPDWLATPRALDEVRDAWREVRRPVVPSGCTGTSLVRLGQSCGGTVGGRA